jgi:hypothetical protein
MQSTVGKTASVYKNSSFIPGLWKNAAKMTNFDVFGACSSTQGLLLAPFHSPRHYIHVYDVGVLQYLLAHALYV